MKISSIRIFASLWLAVGVVLSFVLIAADPSYAQKKCGDVDTALISCSGVDDSSVEKSGVWFLLNIVLNIMAVGVGVAAIGGLVFAAILYASAADNQEQVKKAKDIITNVVIGIVLFAVMFIAVNYLVPGGILG